MPKIESMFAFVSADTGPDDEGVVAFSDPDGYWFPMVAADKRRVQSFRRMAERIARDSNKEIAVLEFSVRRVVEVIKPG